MPACPIPIPGVSSASPPCACPFAPPAREPLSPPRGRPLSIPGLFLAARSPARRQNIASIVGNRLKIFTLGERTSVWRRGGRFRGTAISRRDTELASKFGDGLLWSSAAPDGTDSEKSLLSYGREIVFEDSSGTRCFLSCEPVDSRDFARHVLSAADAGDGHNETRGTIEFHIGFQFAGSGAQFSFASFVADCIEEIS